MTPPRVDDSPFRAWLGGGEVREAGAWLVEHFDDEVFGLCAAMVRDRLAAEDLAQEVFGRAFAALGAFRGEASARTWLLRIARNCCIDYLRARERDPWRGLGEESEEPDLHPDDAPLPADLLDRRSEVEAALSALAEGERALVVLRFKNGLDYSELADAFGLREGAVRMRVSRALSRMRESLAAREAVPASRSAVEEELPPPRSVPAPAPQAPASAGIAPARARKRALFGLLGAGGAAPPAPPAGHPLTRYFSVTRYAPDGRLRERLLAEARAL